MEAITLNVVGGDDDDEFTESLTDNYLKLHLRGRHDPNHWLRAGIEDVVDGALVGVPHHAVRKVPVFHANEQRLPIRSRRIGATTGGAAMFGVFDDDAAAGADVEFCFAGSVAGAAIALRSAAIRVLPIWIRPETQKAPARRLRRLICFQKF